MEQINHIVGVRLKDQIPENNYLSDLPVIKTLQRIKELEFDCPITFFVGENGSGKSTLIEAMAINYGFNPEGGTLNYNFETKRTHSDLYKHITLIKSYNRAKSGYFLRAESFYNSQSYTDYLDDLLTDYTYAEHIFKSQDNPLSRHCCSHGEGFLATFDSFTKNGIYILDEPEAALSPVGIMKLMSKIHTLSKQNSQFIISTHSPLLLLLPSSSVYQITQNNIEKVNYTQTDHYVITRKFLENPALMLKNLLDDN